MSREPDDRATTAESAQPGPAGGLIRAELPADLTSARQARAAIRQALAAWGMADPGRDAELLVSELTANAAEHGGGQPISLTLRRSRGGITCEVTDTSPHLPRACQAGPGDERGRGLAIVTALADASGTRTEAAGKTTWFTLALHDRIDRAGRDLEPEPGA